MKYYFPLKQREYPKKLNKFVIAGILFLFAFTYYFSQGSLCKLNAASISDYCYRYTLNINNTTDSANPNYLGEFIEWLGWAIMTWSWAGLVFFLWTVCNLFPRAISNHKWYQNKFTDYPKERKAVIPNFI